MSRFAGASDVFVANGFDNADVERALDWAASAIEGYTGRTFDLVVGDTVLLDPHFGSAMLPCYPVVAVTNVSAWMPATDAGGMAWKTLTNYAYVPETGLLYNTTGLPGTNWQMGPSWPWLPASLRVTYDHGYAEIPSALRDVCVRLAQQYLENPALAMNTRVGEVEARYSGSMGSVFTHQDRAVLDRFTDIGVG